MSMCIGKLAVNDEGVVENVPYFAWEYEGAKPVTESRNLELGDDSQSLTDIFLSKLLEGILGEAEVLKDGENLRIEYTKKNPFWIVIEKDSGKYIITGDEPAA